MPHAFAREHGKSMATNPFHNSLNDRFVTIEAAKGMMKLIQPP
ncbi:hypothetical protein QP794_15155 [Paenibacillus sp. UMB7766-LJ446]|nr:hypothetical protein [Paenibacillus sp. UMB7766-LJ446]